MLDPMRGVLGVFVVTWAGAAHAGDAAPVSPDPAPEPQRGAWTSRMDAVHSRFDAFAALGLGYAYSSGEANQWHPLARLGLGWTRQTARRSHAVFASYEIDRISPLNANLTYLVMNRRSVGGYLGPAYNFKEQRLGANAGVCISLGTSSRSVSSSAFHPCFGVSLYDRDNGMTFAITYTTIYEIRAVAHTFGGG
jgi:hypothetical protein